MVLFVEWFFVIILKYFKGKLIDYTKIQLTTLKIITKTIINYKNPKVTIFTYFLDSNSHHMIFEFYNTFSKIF